MTERQRDIDIGDFTNTQGVAIGDSAHTVAQHQANQQQVIFATYTDVERMTTEQRIESTMRTVLLLQADFVSFEVQVQRLVTIVTKGDKLLERMNTLLIVLCGCLFILLVINVMVLLYMNWFI